MSAVQYLFIAFSISFIKSQIKKQCIKYTLSVDLSATSNLIQTSWNNWAKSGSKGDCSHVAHVVSVSCYHILFETTIITVMRQITVKISRGKKPLRGLQWQILKGNAKIKLAIKFIQPRWQAAKGKIRKVCPNKL